MTIDLHSIVAAPLRLLMFFALLIVVRGLPALLVYLGARLDDAVPRLLDERGARTTSKACGSRPFSTTAAAATSSPAASARPMPRLDAWTPQSAQMSAVSLCACRRPAGYHCLVDPMRGPCTSATDPPAATCPKHSAAHLRLT